MRRNDVAELANVPESQVIRVTASEVREAYAASVVVDVATQEPATYWRVGSVYYLDAPHFGDVVAIDDLRYDSTLGLYDSRHIKP